MVGDILNGDDDNSTKLEGKKLKKRGVVIDGELIEIDTDSPGVGQDREKETRQFFTEREYDKGESEEEREERLKKEKLATLRLQQEQLKQQQKIQEKEQVQNPNKRLDKIEQGVMLSQNRGKPVQELEFKHDGVAVSREKNESPGTSVKDTPLEKKNDLAGAYFLVGDNVKNLDFKDQVPPGISEQKKYDLEHSVPATKVPDIREQIDNGKGNER